MQYHCVNLHARPCIILARVRHKEHGEEVQGPTPGDHCLSAACRCISCRYPVLKPGKKLNFSSVSVTYSPVLPADPYCQLRLPVPPAHLPVPVAKRTSCGNREGMRLRVWITGWQVCRIDNIDWRAWCSDVDSLISLSHSSHTHTLIARRVHQIHSCLRNQTHLLRVLSSLLKCLFLLGLSEMCLVDIVDFSRLSGAQRYETRATMLRLKGEDD